MSDLNDGLPDAPIDDGSDKPLGYVTDDGVLEVRESVDRDGTVFRGYHETELGQHDRWLRQAPELFEKYMALLSERDDLAKKLHGTPILDAPQAPIERGEKANPYPDAPQEQGERQK